jgi:hypothetical protein
MAATNEKRPQRVWPWLGYQGAALPPGVKPIPPKGPAAWVPVDGRAASDSSKRGAAS